jgi:hypothetical protein
MLDVPMPEVANPQAPPKPGGGLGAALPGLLAVLQKHPELPGSFLSGIIGNFGALSEQRHAAQAQRRSDFGASLSNLAMQPGMTPEMLQAQASTLAPNIAGSQFGQNALGQLATALPENDVVPPDDIVRIQETVSALAADDGSTLNDAITQVVQAARLGGAPDAVLEKMKQYVTKLWGDAKGWETFGAAPMPETSQPSEYVDPTVTNFISGQTGVAPPAPKEAPFSSLADFIRNR